MRYVFDSVRWTWMTGVIVLGTAALGTSCLQVNTGHCALAGGDVACGEAAFCVGAVGGRSEAIASADAQGCMGELPAEGKSWVHVEHGLPTATLMRDATGGDAATTTVEGIVTRVLEGFDPSKPGCQERLEAIGDLAGIRRRILSEDGRRASVAVLTFGEVERERIIAFNDDLGAAIEELEADCSTSGSTTTSTSTGLDATATEESTATTDTPPCTSPEDCTDPATPFCGTSGECVATCEETDAPDAACAERNPALSVCQGVCVQCTPTSHAACTDTTPICDPATNTCVACTAHEQCGGAACNLFDGDCLPADQVVHVGPGQQFSTLGEAVASFGGNEAKGTIIVHPDDYNESVLVGGGRVLAFLAADLGPKVEPPRWVRTSGNEPQLTVGPGTTVLMDGLQLSTNASSSVPALRVDGRAWLDRSRVVQNAGGGIVADSSATLVLRNCFVGGNGSGGQGSFGIDVNDADVRILYSTIARNDEETIDTLHCADGTIEVRNSILVGRDASSIDCPGATILNSAVDEDIGDNANVGAAVLGWFVNATSGDFHLTPSGATTFDDIALWTLGDPTTDIDGDPRPSTDDTPDFAGADVP